MYAIHIYIYISVLPTGWQVLFTSSDLSWWKVGGDVHVWGSPGYVTKDSQDQGPWEACILALSMSQCIQGYGTVWDLLHHRELGVLPASSESSRS